MEESRAEAIKRANKRRIRKKRRMLYIVMTAVFVVIIGGLVVVNFLKPDTTFSENENRVLAQRPAFSLTGVMDGSFMTSYESYASDQFSARDAWISLKLNIDRLLGKRESNGVLLGKDGYLMEAPASPESDNVTRNIEAIKTLADAHKDLNIYMSLIPNAANILADKLPNNAPVRNQAKDIASMNAALGTTLSFVDVSDALKSHSSEYLYYKTDHHWTSLGAYYAFGRLATVMGISEVANQYDIYSVTENFSGTLASKSGYHGSTDTIEIYVPKNVENEYVVNYVDQQKKTATLYNSSALEEKDQYTVFLGGNYPLVEISTTNTGNRRLLLIKDSYANCFVQFLTPYFREIVMVDPRYYYDSLSTLIQSQGITDILFLYNADTFFEDNSLADVLES